MVTPASDCLRARYAAQSSQQAYEAGPPPDPDDNGRFARSRNGRGDGRRSGAGQPRICFRRRHNASAQTDNPGRPTGPRAVRTALGPGSSLRYGRDDGPNTEPGNHMR